MVKEFDVGLAAQFWVLLDLDQPSHYYMDDVSVEERENTDQSADQLPFRADDTEELSVTLAASMAQRLMELSLPVGMAVNGESGQLLRPDNGPDHLSRIMENLASAKAAPAAPLHEFLYSIRPHLNHFHSVTVVTANTDPSWLSALMDLKRGNVTVSIALIDPMSFGSDRSTEQLVANAASQLVPVYTARRDTRLDDSLSRPGERGGNGRTGPCSGGRPRPHGAYGGDP